MTKTNQSAGIPSSVPIFPAATNAEGKTAKAIYNDNSQKRTKLMASLLAALAVIELMIGGYLYANLAKRNVPERLSREIQLLRTGTIALENGNYMGETDFGYFFGTGSFQFKSNASATGTWLDNQLSGQTEIQFPDQGSYTGEVQNSQRNGKGVYTWADGSYYDGEWKDDKMCGEGKYHSSGGTDYAGTFDNNCFISGQCSFSDDLADYLLKYSDGEIETADILCTDGTVFSGAIRAGYGETTYADGDRYQGSFKDGNRSENGTYVWNTGDSYSGSWANDKMEGQGTYTFAGSGYAKGTFRSNAFISGKIITETENGQCTYTVENGTVSAVEFTTSEGTYYNGEIHNGALTGEATIKYKNGDRYDGSVINGLKSGTGTYIWNDGSYYTGSWSSDTMNGDGTYYYKDTDKGYAVSGTFTDGKLNGKCTYYTSATKSFETDWKDGRCIKIYE